MIDLVNWLNENTLSWSLEVDPEKMDYQSRRDYLAQQQTLNVFDPDENDVPALLAADHLVEARAYHRTPVGFFEVSDVTVEAALRRLCAELGRVDPL